MEMFQEGISMHILPENAYCDADEEKRSPLDLDECPMGYEECSGDCIFYGE